MSISVSFLPETAPFTTEQGRSLGGLVAEIFSEPMPASTSEVQQTRMGRVLIMPESQRGNAKSLAEEISGQLAAAGFEAPVIAMVDHEEVDLASEQQLVIVTSTREQGDPPDGAVELWERLSAGGQGSLGGLRFAVCGLGDSRHLDFFGMGKRYEARLEELGATRMLPGVGSDINFEETAGAWSSELLAGCGGTSVTPSAVSNPLDPEQEVYSRTSPFRAKLLKNIRLNAEGGGCDSRHLEFSLEGSGLQYEAGDALGVVPTNCPEIAAALIGTLGWTGDEIVSTPAGERKPLRDALVHDYAIAHPGRKLVSAYSELSGTKLDTDSLHGREIIDLATDFPTVRFSPDEFVALLGEIQPRLFPISSCPRVHPGEVHLTVATVGHEANGRMRTGGCSAFLAARDKGESVRVFVHPSEAFKPPIDLAAKLIMVGPGTGIAPFRAFLEERRETGASGGNWLFFGNPHRATDFLYKGELTQMIEDGHLHRFDTAWSRDGEHEVYVQDRLRENGEELWRWLGEGAYFYVCGEAEQMAEDVDAALHDVVATHGGRGPDGAAEFVSQMKKERRYRCDLYQP